MRTALLLAFALVAVGCGPSELTTDELIKELSNRGVSVADGQKKRSQVQRELDDLNDAMASNVPIPRLAKTVLLDGIPTEVLKCPGKREQAQLIVDYLIRGPKKSDPKFMDAATAMANGSLNIAFESHVFSMSPDDTQDEAALNIVLLLARLEDR